MITFYSYNKVIVSTPPPHHKKRFIDCGSSAVGALILKPVEYSEGLNTQHWNTKPFKVMCSNGPITRRQPFCQPLENRTDKTPTIGILNVFGIPAPTEIGFLNGSDLEWSIFLV